MIYHDNVDEILKIVKEVYPAAYVSLNRKKRDGRRLTIINFNLPDEKMADLTFNGPGWIYLSPGDEIINDNGKIIVNVMNEW